MWTLIKYNKKKKNCNKNPFKVGDMIKKEKSNSCIKINTEENSLNLGGENINFTLIISWINNSIMGFISFIRISLDKSENFNIHKCMTI